MGSKIGTFVGVAVVAFGAAAIYYHLIGPKVSGAEKDAAPAK
jgi:hypothetical protein